MFSFYAYHSRARHACTRIIIIFSYPLCLVLKTNPIPRQSKHFAVQSVCSANSILQTSVCSLSKHSA